MLKLSIRWCLIIVSALAITACSDNPDDLCDLPASTTGSPDITGSPTFSAAAVAAGGLVTVSVPVDAETQTVVVDFAESGTTSTMDSPGATDLGASAGVAQTVDVDVTIKPGALAGTYYPVIMLCSSDLATCTSSVAYAEDPTGFVSAVNYVRGQATYDQGTSTTSFDSSSISNSCVGIGTISIN